MLMFCSKGQALVLMTYFSEGITLIVNGLGKYLYMRANT